MDDQASTVTILAVDDEPTNNELVKRVFHGRPHWQIVTATSGQEALAAAKDREVDVLLVDFAMAPMNGVQLIEEMKRLMPTMIVVLVTAFPDVEAVQQAAKHGLVMHILVKPWSPADLGATVERLLSVRAMKRAVGAMKARTES